MPLSLRSIDLDSQLSIDWPTNGSLRWGMSDHDPDKVDLGARLKEARELATLSQPAVAVLLTHAGIQSTKQAVSAWEKGRNVPDALVLKELAKLYDASADALLGLRKASAEAVRLAVLFDSLLPDAKAGFMEVCGPFLDKHAHVNSDELLTAQDEAHISAIARRIRPAPKRRAG